MFDNISLPVHPSKRHPLTGAPLQALWVSKSGRVCWPIAGGAPDDGAGAGGAGDGSGAGGGQGGPGGTGTGAGSGSGGAAGRTNATDASGADLGFPKDTPVAEMADKEQAAYWRHNARKHEGRVKDLFGDRDPADVKKDLDELAEIRKSQQTPAEQALAAAREEGKAAAIKATRAESAAAIFRGALEAADLPEADVDELVANFNVAGYITDVGVDTTKITNFAKRFSPARGNSREQERRRDFGGGQRREGAPERGAAGKAMAEKRFGKTKTA